MYNSTTVSGHGDSVFDEFVYVVLCAVFAGGDLEHEGDTQQRLLAVSIRHHLHANKTQIFYHYKHIRKEGTVLFNNTLNTFYLRLYGVKHMVKDHSNCKRGNPLPPHGLRMGFFYMHYPTDRITHTTAFVTPVLEHWLEREIA